MQSTNEILLPLGIGIGVGIMSVWAFMHLFPLLVLGGSVYLILKNDDHTNEGESEWQDPGPEQKSSSSIDNVVDPLKK